MNYLKLFVVLFAGLIIQISTVAGAEVEYGKQAAVGAQAAAVAQPVRAEVTPERSELSQASTSTTTSPSSRVAYNQYDEPAAVLGTRESVPHHVHEKRVAIQPMVGGSGYFTRWGNHISNRYSFGLVLDVPLSHALSLEVEGGHGKYDISYSRIRHPFSQWQVGGNLKAYLSRSVIQPYIGGGLMALHYQNMQHGPYYPYRTYSDTIGAGQVLAGADVPITDSIAVGARFAWVIPAFNRPRTLSNGYYSYPYFEEAAAINTQLWRVMGSLKISL